MSKLTLPRNPYRLIAAVDFEKGIVWIKWIGTHRDDDKIDVKEVQYGVKADPHEARLEAVLKEIEDGARRRPQQKATGWMCLQSSSMRRLSI